MENKNNKFGLADESWNELFIEAPEIAKLDNPELYEGLQERIRESAPSITAAIILKFPGQCINGLREISQKGLPSTNTDINRMKDCIDMLLSSEYYSCQHVVIQSAIDYVRADLQHILSDISKPIKINLKELAEKSDEMRALRAQENLANELRLARISKESNSTNENKVQINATTATDKKYSAQLVARCLDYLVSKDDDVKRKHGANLAEPQRIVYGEFVRSRCKKCKDLDSFQSMFDQAAKQQPKPNKAKERDSEELKPILKELLLR